jgi:predicted enzyme related to lactoylglutathione lyase
MGERSGYAPGTFCWVDLATTDQEAAKSFYGSLFGWEAQDVPAGEGATYSLMRLDGKDVAAIAPQPPQQRDAGVPPVWNSYVSVASADETAERAQELGGTVHAAPFDVLEAGRMAVIQDPQGAYVMAWQPKEHFGAALVNAPGALVWNELQSPDPAASASFYGELFGWRIEQAEGMQETYLAVKVGQASNGGIRELAPGTPPSWLAYFGVEDVERALARVGELGGATLAGPIDIGIAKLAVVADPQGAVLAIYAGMLEP